MTDSIVAALIAACVALSVAYLTQFIAENYRRFRDGSALAAGLAGELGSYQQPLPIIQAMLKQCLTLVETNRRDDMTLRVFDRPVDLFFDQAVAKLGLLGSSTVEDVVFVYSNLRAFRMAFELITKNYADMKDYELQSRLMACKGALDRAVVRGAELLPKLHARATQQFNPFKP